ncbi:MAG: spore maturation protein [Alphaproteobacteria bacterium]|nr:spore maturation protein [Alphaproteobacteria bacterium]
MNYIWAAFFVIAFISAAIQSFFYGNYHIWSDLSKAIFQSSETAFKVSIGLTGILCFWLGMMKIAEKSGITDILAKGLAPLFRKIMPDVPQESPAFGAIVMNMAANILGLDNAATPMGLKAIKELQKANPKKDEASDAEILFMVINSSSLTLLPITIFMYRSTMGSINPGAVFIPILIATFASTAAGFLIVASIQKLNIFNRVVLAYAAGLLGVITGIVWICEASSDEIRKIILADAGNMVLILIVFVFIFQGLRKKINIYDEFINGAKDGFDIAVSIIPYLVAMLTAIGLLRSSGALDGIISGISYVFSLLHVNTDFIPALPTAFLKPLSGSGARAMMIETMQNYGADSFPAYVSTVIQGSTETTFYVLAVYFGSVKIIKTRHALPCALFADFIGIVTAIAVSYYFYK